MWKLIPFILCRLQQNKGQTDLFQDLFIASQLLLVLTLFPPLFAQVLWCFALLYQLIGWALSYRLNIPLTKDLFHFLPHPGSFLDSGRHLKIHRYLGMGLLLTALSLIDWEPNPFFWAAVLFASAPFAFYFTPHIPNPLFQAQWSWLKRKKSETPFSFQFPNETAYFLSPQYPVLRKTIAFKGKKQIEISIEGKPNVIFLFMESFRAKNAGCLGAEIAASPQFDRLAETGVLFTRFSANGLQTYRSFLASFFGIPPHIETMSLKPYCSIPLIGLPEILKENGYRTALMQGGNTIFDWTYPFFRAHGFDTIKGKEDLPAEPNQTTSWGVSDETLFAHSLNWIKEQKEPFFLSLFTISNHHPWDPPPGWNFPVDSSLSLPYQRFLQTYSYSDHALGRFIDQLPLENTLIFIFGDHGQGIGERDGPIDIHNDLYQENIHVPLLILGKGVKPARIDAPASQMDLLPTLLDLLQIPAIHHSLGKSLLRQDLSPAYFSLPRGNTQVGLMKGSYKLICTYNEEKSEFYDLEKDPNELSSLPAPEELKQEARAYFQTVNRFFHQKIWTPTQKNSFEIKAHSAMTDDEWIRKLASTPMPSILDLSNTLLSDRALLRIPAEKAAAIHEIDLSNSPLFTDKALVWIAENCKQLMIFNASYCPLLTNTGVKALIDQCPLLRFLCLSGVDDLTHLHSATSNQITALLLRESRNLEGASLAQFVHRCPNLIYLSATLEKTSPQDFSELTRHTQSLIFSWLSDAPHLTDSSLAAFCKQNPELGILILEDFPLLVAPPLPPSRYLMRLKISHCPSLSDQAFDYLAKLPLKEICIAGCPKITGQGLEKLLPLQDCKILLSECPGIKPEEVLSLRAKGLEIY